MKIWKEPRVTLLAKTQIHREGLESFLKAHETALPEVSMGALNTDLLPEIAGRVCYMSFGDKAGRKGPEYLKHILSVGHGSVLEHTNLTIIAEGISRSLSHELVRHRAGCAYSQLSQRYVDVEDMGLVYHPAIVGNEKLETKARYDFEEALVQYNEVVEQLAEEYKYHATKIAKDQGASQEEIDKMNEKELMAFTRTSRRKMAREAAREWLPNATETKIVTTMNIRAWRHFFNMRGAFAADKQIRRFAVAVFKVLGPEAPWCFQDIKQEDTEDEIGCLVCENKKV
jgi:thymidylate synthase (FAD)